MAGLVSHELPCNIDQLLMLHYVDHTNMSWHFHADWPWLPLWLTGLERKMLAQDWSRDLSGYTPAETEWDRGRGGSTIGGTVCARYNHSFREADGNDLLTWKKSTRCKIKSHWSGSGETGSGMWLSPGLPPLCSVGGTRMSCHPSVETVGVGWSEAWKSVSSSFSRTTTTPLVIGQY